jgi:hypothetical protein
MEVETRSVTLRALPKYSGQRTTEDNHHLLWELSFNLYLIPGVQDSLFYPYHRVSGSVEVDRIDRAEFQLAHFQIHEDALSPTIQSDGTQVIVSNPGLYSASMRGSTANVEEVFAEDVERNQVPEGFRCEVDYEIEYPSARGEQDFGLSGTLETNEEGVGQRVGGGKVLGCWVLVDADQE